MTSKNYFASLRAIHSALISGQVLFLLVVFFLLNQTGGSGGLGMAEQSNILLLVALLLSVGGYAASVAVGRAKLQSARQQPTLGGKLNEYRAASVVKIALLEGPSLFAIVGYFLTGKPVFAAMAVLMVCLLFINRPSKEKAIEELELGREDAEALNNPDAVVG